MTMPTEFFCDSCDVQIDPMEDCHCFDDYGDGVTCENCRERAYDRHQERLMEDGPGPTLQEQQMDAYKIKHGLPR